MREQLEPDLLRRLLAGGQIAGTARWPADLICEHLLMNAPWSLAVENAFTLASVGVAVVGQIDGVVLPAVGPAILCFSGTHQVIDRVSVEFWDGVRDSRRVSGPALLLHGVRLQQVAPGSAIHSLDRLCQSPAH